MIVFTEAQPDKNEYRKFKIKTVPSADDTGMLREVLIRRLNHPEWEFPDLILIDGGKGQLSSAKSVLETLHLNIPVIGLIKNEKHVGHKILWAGSSISLETMTDPARNLILRIDSEAHRFAIQYYRKLHKKTVNPN
jgi:excinuclease ABC subunit C